MRVLPLAGAHEHRAVSQAHQVEVVGHDERVRVFYAVNDDGRVVLVEAWVAAVVKGVDVDVLNQSTCGPVLNARTR